MLGSVHEAEDLVQETILRAWRSYDRYDDRLASLRTWLYRIATNVCLTALDGARRRPLPSGLGAPGDDPEQPLVPAFDTPWLQPLPDAMLGTTPGDPATTLAVRGSLRRAFAAAMQYLPARQRAILILRDVLEFSAVEVAGILATTPAAVNSGLQRARARLNNIAPGEDRLEGTVRPGKPRPDRPVHRGVRERQRPRAHPPADRPGGAGNAACSAVVHRPRALQPVHRPGIQATRPGLAHDSPPSPTASRESGHTFAATTTYHAHILQVFSLTESGISRNVVFQDPRLFDLFGLPPTLHAATVTPATPP